MTICDAIADRHYGQRPKMAMAFAELLNEEALELEALGADVIQFDDPAFNAFTHLVPEWGVDCLHRAIEGLKCKTAVHICYGYGIKQNIDWKNTLGDEWRQYEEFFPALNSSRIDQVSLECADSCVFRGIRPVIPTTSGHLNRGIRPPLFSGFEAWVFWLSVLGVFVTCFEVGFSHALAV